jgi:hypothetical protein
LDDIAKVTGDRGLSYQSVSWGGSSLDEEVLTVSTHPVIHAVSHLGIERYSAKARNRLVSKRIEGLNPTQRTWNGEFSLSLQECGVCLDKFLCLQLRKKIMIS